MAFMPLELSWTVRRSDALAGFTDTQPCPLL